jgi:hypothetical protein
METRAHSGPAAITISLTGSCSTGRGNLERRATRVSRARESSSGNKLAGLRRGVDVHLRSDGLRSGAHAVSD